MGEAIGDSWNIGKNILDFGTAPADVTGHKFFDLTNPQLITPGWYVTAIGTTGAGAQFRYMKILSPGVQQFMPKGAGGSTDIALAGAGVLLYENNSQAELSGGLSPQWPTNPVIDSQSHVGFHYMFLVLKWQRWA